MLRHYKLLSLLILTATLSVACTRPGSPANNSSANITEPYTTPLKVGGQQIYVEVVDNDQSRERGLSGRDRLTDQQGMLFDFHNTIVTQPSFWMKGMLFGLDFIWIKDGKIIGITPDAPVEQRTYDEDLHVYSPPQAIDSVLEVNAGWTKNHHVKVGDAVSF